MMNSDFDEAGACKHCGGTRLFGRHSHQFGCPYVTKILLLGGLGMTAILGFYLLMIELGKLSGIDVGFTMFCFSFLALTIVVNVIVGHSRGFR